jgi:hypothetical protein
MSRRRETRAIFRDRPSSQTHEEGVFKEDRRTYVNDALSVSGAIFLILELDSPFSGLLQIFDAPLRNAVAHIGHYPDTALAVTQSSLCRRENRL